MTRLIVRAEHRVETGCATLIQSLIASLYTIFSVGRRERSGMLAMPSIIFRYALFAERRATELVCASTLLSTLLSMLMLRPFTAKRR